MADFEVLSKTVVIGITLSINNINIYTTIAKIKLSILFMK